MYIKDVLQREQYLNKGEIHQREHNEMIEIYLNQVFYEAKYQYVQLVSFR